MFGVRAAVLAAMVGAIAMAAPSEAAFTPQEATFTLKYSSEFSFSRIGVKTAKPGCDAERGTDTFTQRATAGSTTRVKIQRRRSGRGIEFMFLPVKPTGLRAPFPLTLTLAETERSRFESSAPNDVREEDKFGQFIRCTQGAFRAMPEGGMGDSTCRYQGNLFLVEKRGQVRAQFAQRGEKPRCGTGDEDGYPAQTNSFPMIARIAQSKLYGERVNVLKATGAKRKQSAPVTDDSGTMVTTETAKADWTMTLTRTSSWRRLR